MNVTVDELSMLIATATVLHRVYTFDQTLAVTVWAGVAMTAALAAFSVYHCFTDSLLAHSGLFGKSNLHVAKKRKPYSYRETRHYDMCGRYSNTLHYQRQNFKSSGKKGCQEASYMGSSCFHLRIRNLEP